MPASLIVILVLVTITADFIVGVALWRSGNYDRSQKAIQTILICALPIIGAVVIAWMLRRIRLEERSGSTPGESLANDYLWWNDPGPGGDGGP